MDRALSRAARSYLVVTAFLAGFALMVLEMAAVRAMAPYFGASIYTWTNVIGVILAALSVGYYIGGRVADRWPSAAVLFGFLLAGGILALLVPIAARPVSRWLLPSSIAVEEAVAVSYRASLAATLILFAPPAFLLATISPMAIKLLATPTKVGNASGRIFAASTIGSILGTFLTTFLFVPHLGTRMTIGLSGAMLVATAVLGLLISAFSVRRALVGAGGGAVTGLLLFAAVHAGPIKRAPSPAGATKVEYEQLAECDSAYQYLRVVDRKKTGRPTARLLQINEAQQAYQSVTVQGSYLTEGRYYDYYSALPLLLGSPARRSLRVLVVGLATGTIPQALHHFYPRGLKVEGVEIDPEVLALGREYFHLPKRGAAPWLDQVVADGRVYLRLLPKTTKFDLVIIDAFAQERYIPFQLATVEAFREAKDHLAPGGILAMNVSAYRADGPLLLAIEATLRKAFGRAYRVGVVGYSNYMVFAVNGGRPHFERLLLSREAMKKELAGVSEAGALGDVAWQVGMQTVIVPADRGGQVLSDDHAPVEALTDRGVRRESRGLMGH